MKITNYQNFRTTKQPVFTSIQKYSDGKKPITFNTSEEETFLGTLLKDIEEKKISLTDSTNSRKQFSYGRGGFIVKETYLAHEPEHLQIFQLIENEGWCRHDVYFESVSDASKKLFKEILEKLNKLSLRKITLV